MRAQAAGRVCAVAATVATFAGAANAQISFTYQFEGLPAVAAPGSTFQLTVLCKFTPDVGQLIAVGLGAYPVWGLESGQFSITGTGGNWSDLSLIPPFTFPLGTSAGVPNGGNVTGVIWGTGFVPPAIPSTINPTPVWRGTFTMPSADVILSLTPTGTGQHGLWLGPHASGLGVVANGPASGTQVTILVPAPAAFGVLLFSGLVAGRRRSARRRQ